MKALLALAFFGSASAPAFAENRAIVFSTTCPEYEVRLDDIAAFVVPAIGELDPLKQAGWNVIPLLGGNSVWCDASTPGCIRTQAGSLDHLLEKSSFKSFQIKPASKTNLLSALNAALSGPDALRAGDKLLVSVITHGNRDIFCSADGYVAYETMVPIFKKLKDKGIQMGFDADHCFSGGGVQKLSPYACVVSIASSTTTGLEGNPTLENLLANHPNPTLEDLYLSRTVSYNALTQLREPEISGFGPGAAINDVLSDKMYPGDKNDLRNDTLVSKCAKAISYYGPDCDAVGAALKVYQSTLGPWENASHLRDHSSEVSALMEQYPDSHFPDAHHLLPLNAVTDSQVYQNLINDFAHIQEEASQHHAFLESEERGLKLVREAVYPHYLFSTDHLAEPGTDSILLKIVNENLRLYHLPSVDSSGHVTNAQALVTFLSPRNVGQIAHSIGNEYYNELIRYHAEKARAQAAGEEDLNSDSENAADDVQPSVAFEPKSAEEWQKLILARLNESITPYFTQVKTDSREELLNFLLGHDEEFSKRSVLEIQLNKDYAAFQYRLSGRLSYSLTSSYFDYKAKLTANRSLNPHEASDKAMLDSCSNFTLR